MLLAIHIDMQLRTIRLFTTQDTPSVPQLVM